MPASWGFYLTLAWKSPIRLSYKKIAVKPQFCKLGEAPSTYTETNFYQFIMKGARRARLRKKRTTTVRV
jgi:hypothetical protein